MRVIALRHMPLAYCPLSGIIHSTLSVSASKCSRPINNEPGLASLSPKPNPETG